MVLKHGGAPLVAESGLTETVRSTHSTDKDGVVGIESPRSLRRGGDWLKKQKNREKLRNPEG